MKPPPTDSPGKGTTTVAVVLTSLLGYPGGGHFLVKKAARGGAWAAIFSVFLVGMLTNLGSNLYHLYNTSTTLGDLETADLRWGPCLAWTGACIICWVLAALDATRYVSAAATVEPIAAPQAQPAVSQESPNPLLETETSL